MFFFVLFLYYVLYDGMEDEECKLFWENDEHKSLTENTKN